MRSTACIFALGSLLAACEAEEPMRGGDFERRNQLEAAYEVPRAQWSRGGDKRLFSVCPGGLGYHSVGSTKHAPPELGKIVARRKGAVVGLESPALGGKRDVYCSGVLLGSRHVLTAAHCVDGMTDRDRVVVGYDGPQSKAVTYEFAAPAEVFRHYILDFSILRLSRSVTGVTPVGRPSRVIGGSAVVVIHHPDGLPKHYSVGGWSMDANRRLLYHRADTEHGSSGAGVFDRHGALVGLHTDGGCSEYGDNYGILGRELVARIPTWAYN